MLKTVIRFLSSMFQTQKRPINMTSNLDKQYHKFKASPIFWRKKAEGLKYSAELLWPIVEKQIAEMHKSKLNSTIDLGPDIFPVFLGLIGFSTECLFKAVVIRDKPEYVSNGSLSSKLTNHDLLKLAELAKIELSPNEKIFCKQAFNTMLVDFRYPVAKVATPLKTSFTIGGNCKDVFNGLYNRIYPTIDQLGVEKKLKQKKPSL